MKFDRATVNVTASLRGTFFLIKNNNKKEIHKDLFVCIILMPELKYPKPALPLLC